MVHDGVRLLRAADEDGDGIHWEMLKGVESTLQVENENRPEAEGGPVGEGTSTTRRTQVWITMMNDIETGQSVYWNGSVLLALPAIWTAWAGIWFASLLLIITWRMNVEGVNSPTIPQDSIGPATEYIPRVAVTIVFVIGVVYLVLMIRTLHRL